MTKERMAKNLNRLELAEDMANYEEDHKTHDLFCFQREQEGKC